MPNIGLLSNEVKKTFFNAHPTLAGKVARPEDETQVYDADAAAAEVVDKTNKFEGDRVLPDSQPRTAQEERELLGSPQASAPEKVCVCVLKL